MAKDVTDMLGTALGKVARETAKSVASSKGKSSNGSPFSQLPHLSRSNGSGSPVSLSGSKGVAAGVGAAALAPLAVKGAGKLVRGVVGEKLEKAGGPAGIAKDLAGGPAGIAKEAGKQVLPGMGGGGKGGKSKGIEGVGKGRRMPVQQDLDIGVPLKTVYEQWIKYEEWPEFMHRLDNVSQEDDEHITFKTKIWGFSRQFKAEIVDHRPCERIKWTVVDGVTHTGVVTFHELGPTLTRVELNLDVQPGGMIEKAARGMRHVKRAVRADMARFKAYVLTEGDYDSDEAFSRGEEQQQQQQQQSRERGSSSGNGRSSGGRSSSPSRSSSSRGRSSSSGSGSRAATKRSSSSRGSATGSSGSATKRSSSSGGSATKRSSSSSGSGTKRGSSSSRSGSTNANGSSASKRTTARGRSSSKNGRSRSSRSRTTAGSRS